MARREREREREKRRPIAGRRARSCFCTRHEGRVQVRSAAHPLPLEASNHLSTGTSCAAIGRGVLGGRKRERERERERAEGGGRGGAKEKVRIHENEREKETTGQRGGGRLWKELGRGEERCRGDGSSF